METTLSEKDSLKVIYEMIESSKTNIKENAIFFLLWGWLALIASILHFVLIKVDYPYSFIPWPAMMLTGTVASIIIGYRMGQRSTSMTIIDKAMIYVWYGFFVLVLSIIVVSALGKMNWDITQPMIIGLYSFATFVSGGILKFRPLILGGVFGWICSVIAFFMTFPNILLMVAASIIVAYLIPGYMLKAKKEG
ncbi:MAG: hypothetical protein K9G58_15885 [Bacteroidales bacterium]|nr:hypothetical protein [Bacteroidales bacterium]MCF8387640.1 hypothetical protein [Bacteroidales bacterium]MCF8399648.1 hypothetical protein [Bacteroidales bacterium]